MLESTRICKLSKNKQLELMKYFIVCATARS